MTKQHINQRAYGDATTDPIAVGGHKANQNFDELYPAVEANTSAIAAETTRATAAEQANSDAISAETARATAAESANSAAAAAAAALAEGHADRHAAAGDDPLTITAAQVSDFASASDARIAAARGAVDGIAPLDSTSKIPASFLPSYVDDVLEYANLAAFPGTGETGKIYVALDTGKIYRWSGSAYVEITSSPGSTDAVPEGATNLYFTNARASAAAPVQSVGGKTGAVPFQTAAETPGLSFFATLANLSGQVTTSGSGDTSLANATVTNAQLATMAANTIKANNTVSAGEPLDITPAQLGTMLSLGTSATQNANAVAITGGTIGGLTTLAVGLASPFTGNKAEIAGALAVGAAGAVSAPTNGIYSQGQVFASNSLSVGFPGQAATQGFLYVGNTANTPRISIHNTNASAMHSLSGTNPDVMGFLSTTQSRGGLRITGYGSGVANGLGIVLSGYVSTGIDYAMRFIGGTISGGALTTRQQLFQFQNEDGTQVFAIQSGGIRVGVPNAVAATEAPIAPLDARVDSSVTTGIAATPSPIIALNMNTTTGIYIAYGAASLRANGTKDLYGRFGYQIKDRTLNAEKSDFVVACLSNNTLAEHFRITSVGNVGIRNTAPTAALHLPAGTATPNTGPLKFTVSGASPVGTPETGLMEVDATNIFYTPSTTRHTIAKGLVGSASLNFPSTNGNSSSDLTISVPGAADGDEVKLGVPISSQVANGFYTAFVSAADTVTVRFTNSNAVTASDPAAGTFKVFVTKR